MAPSDHPSRNPQGSLHPHGSPEPPQTLTARTPLVELMQVTCTYAHSPAIRDISLKIWPGQFLAVVGPSGGGKTTLLRTVLGMVHPVQGWVLLRGQPLGNQGKAKIGYVPQLQTIDWNFPITVQEVILMGFYRKNHWFRGIGKSERERVDRVMEQLKLTGLSRRQIRELSGGQQQAVFLARALLGDPDLILLDEPASGLDIRSRDDVVHFLHEISHEGVSIVITAHDLNWIAAHLPWVICLNQRIIAEGPPQQVFTSSVLKETYRGEIAVFQHDGMIMIGERPHSSHREG